eukprot:PhM_4_TR1276/c0_g1_i1/m.90023
MQPLIRSHSGSRTGTAAFLETMGSAHSLTGAKKFNKDFKLNYRKHYPDATDAQVDQVLVYLIKGYDWGIGGDGKMNTTQNAINIARMPSRSGDLDLIAKKFHHMEALKEDSNMTRERGRTEERMLKTHDQYGDVLKRKKDLPEKKAALEALTEQNKKKLFKERATSLLKLKRLLDSIKSMSQNEFEDYYQTLEDTFEGTPEMFEKLKEYEKKERMHAEHKQKDREEFDNEVKTYNANVSSSKGEPPQQKRDDITSTVELKDFEEDQKAEDQYRKINKKTVKKIDNNVKFDKADNNTKLNETVPKSAIRRALDTQRNRLKMTSAHVKFTRLGTKTKHDTQNII